MLASGFSTGSQIAVVSGSHERARWLCEKLSLAGLSARSADFTSPADVILFDLTSCNPSLVADMADYAATYGANRPIVATLGESHHPTDDIHPIDVRLSSDAAIALAPARFRFARRSLARQAESELRNRTYEQFGVSPAKRPPRALRRSALFLGDASAVFPALSLQLETAGLDLTAAFSAYTAFDYLESARFDAVILDATAQHIQPDAFCDMVYRTPGLTELPILSLIDDEVPIAPSILRRSSDLISSKTSMTRVARQLQMLIQEFSSADREFTPPSPDVTDAFTGLFSRSFFEAHLREQAEWACAYNQPLSLLRIRIYDGDQSPHGTENLAKAARLVRSLVRTQDAPTRLDWFTLAVSMPAADEQDALMAAQRVNAVLDATAFSGDLETPSRQIAADCRVFSFDPEVGADGLLRLAAGARGPNHGHAA